jgi:hypothetical protein
MHEQLTSPQRKSRSQKNKGALDNDDESVGIDEEARRDNTLRLNH